MFPEHAISSSTIVDAFGFADVLPSVGTAQLGECIIPNFIIYNL